ncbi:MAG: CpsD/CapB family tyrosine-protein kinase [Clostridia bacterium]|nr:CpsD/CapB family tyrosine-protein kinase [Clostridia bacterium]
MKLFDLFRRKRKNTYESIKNPQNIVLNGNSSFEFAESLRSLKVTLSVALPKREDGKGVSIMCVSSYSKEGKTTIAINLAVSLSSSSPSRKIVVLDADLRKGNASYRLIGDPVPGLTDYLSGSATFEEILRPVEGYENLYVIPRGSLTVRPYDLLSSNAMKDLLDNLNSQFAYTIIDTAPMRMVSDALAIAPFVAGSVLVCRHKDSYEGDIKKAVAKLHYFKANVLGLIINDYVEKKNSKLQQALPYYTYIAQAQEQQKHE